MVVSKNKTMKLGAALVTATLGATGIACDGDQPGCEFPIDEILNGASYDSIESYWDCEMTVDGEGSEGAGFVIFGDGTAAIIPLLEFSWEESDGLCDAPVFTLEEGYGPFEDVEITDFSLDGDNLTFGLLVEYEGDSMLYSLDCEKIDIDEVP